MLRKLSAVAALTAFVVMLVVADQRKLGPALLAFAVMLVWVNIWVKQSERAQAQQRNRHNR
jgi:hypothetical protein